MLDYKEQKKYYPTLVSDTQGVKKKGEGLKRVEKLNKLPQKAQDLLFSDEIVEFIFSVEQRFHLRDEQTEEFSRSVRKYFFREITERDFIIKISALCRVSLDEAQKLFKTLINIRVNSESGEVKNYIKLSFDDAIKKYPQILRQIITSRNIIAKPFLKPLKPSVRNWIMVYEKILDVSKHNTIERGEFVFRSEATKGLDEKDRKKLLTLFKSRDEGTKLVIDIDNVKIIFTDLQKNKNQIQTKQNPQQINKQDVQINKKLPTDVQEEILKNKIEMGKVSVKPQKPVIKQQKIGSGVFSATKTNQLNISENIVKTHHNKPFQQEVEQTPKRNQNSIGTPLQKDDLDREKLINELKPQKQIIEEKPKEKGKISFSSNHILPAEKDKNLKKKQNLQQNTYNAFNMKPIGSVHNTDTKKKEK